jgi:hypothetical protein
MQTLQQKTVRALRSISIAALSFTLGSSLAVPVATLASKNSGRESITADEMKEWLGYLASDELEGRSTFTEGLGLAAAYIADHLKAWSIKPAGDSGSYFQRVKVLGVKSTNRSTVTLETAAGSRTFKLGEGIQLPANVGGRRTFTADQIEFLGYGLNAPLAGHNDYSGKKVKGKVVVWLGPAGPKGLDQQLYRRALFGRSRYATDQEEAVAAIGPAITLPGRQGGQPATTPQTGFPGVLPLENADFTTVQRLDAPLPPAVAAQDEFLEFLFAGQEAAYADLKAKVTSQEPLPQFTIKNVRVTFNLDADYRVVRTRYTRNVIGVVEGSDQKLKDTYVAFGAHYDHVGYSEGEIIQSENGPKRTAAVGRIKDGAIEDRIWNGADDDGSGTVALMAIAKGFATGPKPHRSLLFVWHAGEEIGLLGSRYYADYPTIPMDHIVAELNMDMVGRNRDDKAEEAGTLYLVGSDRISTELHNLAVTANGSIGKPLKLDYEMNDPTDLEQVYYRSDHYSYAAKGIPIIFFTTGMHSDYHFNTDSAEKIDYDKMARVGQLVYEVGVRVANMDHPPVRDNRGPRVGKGSSGKLTN